MRFAVDESNPYGKATKNLKLAGICLALNGVQGEVSRPHDLIYNYKYYCLTCVTQFSSLRDGNAVVIKRERQGQEAYL